MIRIKGLYEFLNNLSPREKKIFYIALFILGSVFIDRLVISPIIYRMQTLTKEIEEKESSIRRYLQIISQKDRVKQQINKLSIFFENLKPSEDDTTSILKELERLANKSGVYIVDIKPAGLRQEGNFKKYVINLSCEVQMEQLVEFMYNIESSHKLLTIERYQISPKSKETSIASCTMTITKLVSS
ncbi:MAG: type 4a pilus biogenesis protein PilO [Candidatus Omnitrophica bacterium]|nr:type 4a pilus biogenesis protein PilO [Candidatus Omnitrophota bacterium]